METFQNTNFIAYMEFPGNANPNIQALNTMQTMLWVLNTMKDKL